MSRDSLPLATMVILAYNQEEFIDEAIAAALAQDYSNLEIVFSDDCSTDGTFTRIERAVAAYKGPHRLVVNRTARNGTGLVRHFYEAVERSAGKFIIVGAGDDIAYPQRVGRLVEAWRETGAQAISSACQRIDAEGRPFGPVVGDPVGQHPPSRYFVNSSAGQIHGATAAYDRQVFENIRCPDQPIYTEDAFFGLMLAARGFSPHYLAEPLVGYRSHPGAISGGAYDTAEFERRSAWAAGALADLLELLGSPASKELVAPDYGTQAVIDWEKLRGDLAYSRYRAGWMTMSLPARLAAMVRFTDPQQRRWMLPRLFGLRPLAASKKLAGRSA
ncbi:glycosyltransferase [Sphingomonas humi]|uniref:Glycosyltransferase 2-like domain-containing protein n=1 Tax=Sphingomonas humi TaxID=335630 RepID=A0ABP7SDU6_9SPHN